MSSKPVAVLVSDLHIRSTTPRSRAETSWYEVLGPALQSLGDAADRLKIPIICAGDIFDRWNPSADLVSWSMDWLPQMYAIPGQHEIEGHCHDHRDKGIYGALVKAGVIEDLDAETWTVIRSNGTVIHIWAMPWGRYSCPEYFPEGLKLLVAHKYIHIGKGSCYATAPEDASAPNQKKMFEGFQAALVGDNHIPWTANLNGCNIYNHGGFLPQNSDQKNLIPSYGILLENGEITVHPLDVSEPKWQLEIPSDGDGQSLASGAIEALGDLKPGNASFADRLFRAAENAAHEELSKILREVWEKCRE